MTAQAVSRGLGLSMRAVIFVVRKRFPTVNHLDCNQVEELSKSQDVVYLVSNNIVTHYPCSYTVNDISHVKPHLKLQTTSHAIC